MAPAPAAAPRPSAPEPPAPAADPPSAAERTAAVEPAGEEDAVVRWRQAVDRVKERKLLLGTCLEEGLFLGIAGSNVRVALSPEHALHRAMIEMKENREILNEEFGRLYGRGATLVCVSGDQAVTDAGYAVRPAVESDRSPTGRGRNRRVSTLRSPSPSAGRAARRELGQGPRCTTRTEPSAGRRRRAV